MITTTHARPVPHIGVHTFAPTKVVLCPRCAQQVGAAHGKRQAQALLGVHRCNACSRDAVQPSTALPFN